MQFDTKNTAYLIGVDGNVTPVLPDNTKRGFTLHEAQELIGGYVQVVYLDDGRLLIVDEEGLLKRLPVNHMAQQKVGYPIVGPALVCPKKFFK